jgi:hypothetical protein
MGSSDFNRRLRAWTERHPWRYAASLGFMEALLWFLGMYFIARADLLFALVPSLATGVGWFLAWGWWVPRARRRLHPPA